MYVSTCVMGCYKISKKSPVEVKGSLTDTGHFEVLMVNMATGELKELSKR